MNNWSGSFAPGDFRNWTFWGQGQENLYPKSRVVHPLQEHPPVPRCANSKHVARFEVTPADVNVGRYHAKLYKNFPLPANIDGAYAASYFVPDTYTVPTRTSVNVFQFKEQFASGASDPSWWIEFDRASSMRGVAKKWGVPMPETARDDSPVVWLNRWGASGNEPRQIMAVPLGEWFEIRADVRQGHGILWTVAGNILAVSAEQEYPIGPVHPDSRAWVFGVGNYSTGANGPLYVDRASFRKEV